MKKFFTIGIFFFFIITIIAIIMATTACNGMDSSAIKTSDNVDLNKYMGKWYEIARLPNSFQKGNENAYAVYTMRDDGKVEIVNTAFDQNGISKSASAIAYAPNPKDASKLRVSFFWPIYADYFILELGDKYEWALVGGTNMRYLWILSRTPDIQKETLDKIVSAAKLRGYDVSKLIFSTASKTGEFSKTEF